MTLFEFQNPEQPLVIEQIDSPILKIPLKTNTYLESLIGITDVDRETWKSFTAEKDYCFSFTAYYNRDTSDVSLHLDVRYYNPDAYSVISKKGFSRNVSLDYQDYYSLYSWVNDKFLDASFLTEKEDSEIENDR